MPHFARLRGTPVPRLLRMSLDPTGASAPLRRHWTRALEFARRGDWPRAASAFESAERLAPAQAVFPLNRARALLRSGRVHDALTAATRASTLDPAEPLARWLQASALARLDRHAEVADVLLALPREQRHDAEMHRLLALSLMHLGRHQDAVAAFLDALSLKIDDAPTHYQLGLAFRALGMRREATECFRTTLALGSSPVEACARALLAFDLRSACEWEAAAPLVRQLREQALAWRDGRALRTEPFVHVALLDDPQAQLGAARACAAAIAAGVRALPPRGAAPRERLRIGYVSADFREHATMHLLIETLERHDRARVEVTLYSHSPDDGSPMRHRTEAACDRFVDIGALSDAQAAQRIRDDGIDILVDLKGYTHSHRLGLFAYRAAPLQASWLGHPGTSGAPFIDYVIGDATVTPLDHEADFSERIAQLPACYQPNDRARPRPDAPPRAECGLPDGALVLASFNQAYKLSPDVFDVWCALLRDLPDAVLWMLDPGPDERAALESEAARRGVGSGRLVWAPRLDQRAHLARLRHADLFLDSWPCNAHTTASDALWAGVPVVTTSGRTFASRVAASLLRAVGLPELVHETPQAYAATVLALARDPARRAALRAHLLGARDTSALFDGARMARDLEDLYLRMWAARCNGGPLPHLPAVPAQGLHA